MTMRPPRAARTLAFALPLLVCARIAAPANAETFTFTTPNSTLFAIPVGISTIHVVAVGGRGGGLAGGFGAVVASDLKVGSFSQIGSLRQVRVVVGGNGAVGAAGAGGGAPGSPLAGGGGGSSSVTYCPDSTRCPVDGRIVAGGGGGGGASGLLGISDVANAGGAGGAAGRPGGAGSAAELLLAAEGGRNASGAASGAGGDGGGSTDEDECNPGADGARGSNGTGGIGAVSDDPDGYGGGGGGGGGYDGGGGGGAGGYCFTEQAGTSGAGGGGGSSRLGVGGTLADDASGQPSVTISYEFRPPSVAIVVPAEGAVYAQGQYVRPVLRCTEGQPFASISTCAPLGAPRTRIDTGTPGPHTLVAQAIDRFGLSAQATVHYTVEDRLPPRFSRLLLVPERFPSAPIEGRHRRLGTSIRFRLNEPATLHVAVDHALRGFISHARCVRPAPTVRTANPCPRWRRVGGFVRRSEAGRHRIHFDGSVHREPLPPGEYRLRIAATDANGNRSDASVLLFTVRR
jgi:hypothetical protein